MKIVFQDPTFSSQLLRTIAETYYKGAASALSNQRIFDWLDYTMKNIT